MEATPQPAKKSVRYQVRSEGGVLTYDTLIHVEQAYLAGWISPDDELRQEGDTEWRKVSSLPQLAKLQKAETSLRGLYAWNLIGAILLAVGALAAFFTGRHWWGLALSLIVASLLFPLTVRAARPRR